MKRSEPEATDNLTDEERETIAALLKYPALEGVFGERHSAAAGAGLEEMRRKMLATVAALERVVRRGSPADAEKAARAIEAYRTTLGFLEELESRRKNPAR